MSAELPKSTIIPYSSTSVEQSLFYAFLIREGIGGGSPRSIPRGSRKAYNWRCSTRVEDVGFQQSLTWNRPIIFRGSLLISLDRELFSVFGEGK